jgi:hypothetical protein
MPEDLPKWDDPGFWTARGCLMLVAAFLSVLAVAAGVFFAIGGSLEGLLLVIAILLAAILFVQATKR